MLRLVLVFAALLLWSGVHAVKLGADANVKVVATSDAIFQDGSSGDGATRINGDPDRDELPVVVWPHGAQLGDLLRFVATSNIGGTGNVLAATVSCDLVLGTTMTLEVANGGVISSGSDVFTVGGTVAKPPGSTSGPHTVTCTFTAVGDHGDPPLVTASGTSVAVDDEISFSVLLVGPFAMVAGTAASNQANGLLTAGSDLPQTASDTGSALQVVIGSSYYGGVAVQVRHQGVRTTDAYRVTCTPGGSSVLQGFTCVVPAGTDQNGVVGCSVLPGTAQGDVAEDTMTCTSGTYTEYSYSYSFAVKVVVPTVLDLAVTVPDGGWSMSGVEIEATTSLRQTSQGALNASLVPVVVGGAGAIRFATDPETTECGASNPALPVVTGAEAAAVGAVAEDTLVFVSCGYTVGGENVGQIGFTTTVAVLVEAQRTFELFSDAEGETALPTNPDAATTLKEGDIVSVHFKVQADAPDVTTYTIMCTTTGPLRAAADGASDNVSVTATSATVEASGSMLPVVANFRVGVVKGEPVPVTITCEGAGALRGSQTAHFEATDTAVGFVLVGPFGVPIDWDADEDAEATLLLPYSTDNSAPTVLREGQLVVRARAERGTVASVEGTITCTLRPGEASSITDTIVATGVDSGAVTPDWAGFKTIVSANQTVAVECVGDGVVFDAEAVRIHATIVDGAPTTSIECALEATTTNSGLVFGLVTDKATVQAAVDHIRVVLHPGESNRASGSTTVRESSVELFAEHLTEAVEGTNYGPGGLITVTLSESPPEDVTVTCRVDAAQSDILADSPLSSSYTFTFEAPDPVASAVDETPRSLSLPAVKAISTGANVAVTCSGRGANGLLLNPATTTLRATPLRIVVEAGVAAVNENGVGLPRGTEITGGADGLKVARIEGVPDAVGASVQVRLNGTPTASVTVACTSGDTDVLPQDVQSSSFTFSTTNATEPQSLRLGTVGSIPGGYDSDVVFTCSPITSGGVLETETAMFVVRPVPLRILVTAGTSARDADGASYEQGDPITNKILRVEGQNDATGASVRVALNADPIADVEVQCSVAVDPGQTLPLADSATDTDFKVTFTSADGTVPKDIKLGTVSAGALADVTVTCAPSQVAGGLSNDVADEDAASFVVLAKPLEIVILAGSAARDMAGAEVAEGMALSSSSVLILQEGAADSVGATIRVRLSGNPSGNTTVTCTPADTGVLSASSASFTPQNGTVAQGINLGSVGSVPHDTDVEVVCKTNSTVDDAGLILEEESKSVTMRVVATRLVVKAGTQAFDEEGIQIDEDTVLTPRHKIRMVEGQAQSATTLKIALTTDLNNANVTVTCQSSDHTVGAIADVDIAADSGTTPVAITLPALGTAITVDITITLTCTGSTSGNLGLGEPVLVTLHVEKLKVVIVAGESAINATTNADYLSGASVGDGVLLVEGDTDAARVALAVKLNGPPVVNNETPEPGVTVSCTSEEDNDDTIAHPTAVLVFDPDNYDTPQALPLAPVGTLTAGKTVRITCTPTSGSGFDEADTGTATVQAEPLAIVMEADSEAVNEDGVDIDEGTNIMAESPEEAVGRKLRVTERQAPGRLVRVRLNRNLKSDEEVLLTCVAEDSSLIPNPEDRDLFEIAFAEGEGLTPKPVTIGTPSDFSNAQDLYFSCRPSNSSDGIAESKSVYLRLEPLRIIIKAGSNSLIGAGQRVTEDRILTEDDVLRVRAGLTTTAGDIIEVALSGRSGVDATIKCSSTQALVIPPPIPASGASTTFLSSSYEPEAGQPVQVGVPTLRYEMMAESGELAREATPTRDQMTIGDTRTRLVAGQVCKSPVVFEGADTGPGDHVQLQFGQSSSGTINCKSSDTDAMADIDGIVVKDATELPLDLPPPAALPSGSKLVTYTCTVSAEPAPVRLTAGLQAIFSVIVLPLTMEIITGTGSPARQSDGAVLGEGVSIGYTESAKDAILITEGAAPNRNLLSLRLATYVTEDLTFMCNSSDSTKAEAITVSFAQSITKDVDLAKETAVAQLEIPTIFGIDNEQTITYTCVPLEAAAGYLTSAANHIVKFDLFVRPARFTAIAGTGATTVAGIAIPGGTILSGTAPVLSRTVRVLETDPANSGKVLLQPNVSPGAEGKMTCKSSSEAMAGIAPFEVANNTFSTPVPLPAPNGISGDIVVTYTCAPSGNFGYMRTTDTTLFFVHVIALRVSAVAESDMTLADGTAVTKGTAIGETPVVAYEGQVVNNTTVGLRANARPSAQITYDCISSNPDLMGHVEGIPVSGTTSVRVELPVPEAVDEDQPPLKYTCTPKLAVGGIGAEEETSFYVEVRKLRVFPRTILGGQIAGDGDTVLASGTIVETGNPSRSVRVVEGTRASQQVVELAPNAGPPGEVLFRCSSSNSDVMDNITGLRLTSATAIPITLPQSQLLDASVTITYTCGPLSNDNNFKAGEIVRFDVVIITIFATILSPRTQPNAVGGTILQDAILEAEDPETTPVIITTSEPDTLVSIQLNGTPTTTIPYVCTSSAPEILNDITEISINSASPIQLTIPRPGSVSELTLIRYVCGPTADRGGVRVTETVSFSIAVTPRQIDAVSATLRTAADGVTALLTGAVITGGGPRSRVIPITEGVLYSAGTLVALRPNVAPSDTVPVQCVSDTPDVLAAPPSVSLVGVSSVGLNIPRSNPVEADVLVTFTCAPISLAGGFDIDVTTSFQILVRPLGLTAVAGSTAGTSAAGLPFALETPLGSNDLSKTLVVSEGAAESQSRVLLSPSDAPQAATAYRCLSSNEEVLDSIRNITILSSSNVALLLPAASAVDVDTIVTYVCSPVPPEVPVVDPEATPDPTATPTPTPTGTPEPPTSRVLATATFDVLVRRVLPIAYSAPGALRADSLRSFGMLVDISGGGSQARTPVIPYRADYAAGEVVRLGFNIAPSGTVTFVCQSSNRAVMENVSAFQIQSQGPVSVALPSPGGDISQDTTVTYTCQPTVAAGGLTTDDSVSFDILVLYHGIVVTAGQLARDATTIRSVPLGTSVGRESSSAVKVAVLSEMSPLSQEASQLLDIRGKTPSAGAVDVNCVSSLPEVIASFNVSGVAFTRQALVIPASTLVQTNTTVTFTCTVECPNESYSGTESVVVDVEVLARGLVPRAGTAAGIAADGVTELLEGTLLVSGDRSSTVQVLELGSAGPGALVRLSTTVAPDANVTVACKSSDPDILFDISQVVLGSATSVLGGTPAQVSIPQTGTVVQDTVVTYTCAPIASAGSYTSAQTTVFDVLVVNQTVFFLSGSRATDAEGRTLTANTRVGSAGVHAIEGVQYGSGELLNIQALQRVATVTCSASCSPETACPDGIAVRASPTATTRDIVVGPEPTPLYFSRMPDLNAGAAEMTVSCSPREDNDASGYLASDTFTAKVTIEDVFRPTPAPEERTPEASFRMTLTYLEEPSPELVAAVLAFLPGAIHRSLVQIGVPDVTAEDITVLVVESEGRRRLLEVSCERCKVLLCRHVHTACVCTVQGNCTVKLLASLDWATHMDTPSLPSYRSPCWSSTSPCAPPAQRAPTSWLCWSATGPRSVT